MAETFGYEDEDDEPSTPFDPMTALSAMLTDGLKSIEQSVQAVARESRERHNDLQGQIHVLMQAHAYETYESPGYRANASNADDAFESSRLAPGDTPDTVPVTHDGALAGAPALALRSRVPNQSRVASRTDGRAGTDIPCAMDKMNTVNAEDLTDWELTEKALALLASAPDDSNWIVIDGNRVNGVMHLPEELTYTPSVGKSFFQQSIAEHDGSGMAAVFLTTCD